MEVMELSNIECMLEFIKLLEVGFENMHRTNRIIDSLSMFKSEFLH